MHCLDVDAYGPFEVWFPTQMEPYFLLGSKVVSEDAKVHSDGIAVYKGVEINLLPRPSMVEVKETVFVNEAAFSQLDSKCAVKNCQTRLPQRN